MNIGARAVQESILQAETQEPIQVFVVWTKMFQIDTLEAAQHGAEELGSPHRVTHFYDADQIVGRAIAEGLGAKSREVAWDIYLFYEKDEAWIDRVPKPVEWAHQLLGSRWADPSRLHQGNALSTRLQEIMKGLAQSGRAD